MPKEEDTRGAACRLPASTGSVLLLNLHGRWAAPAARAASHRLRSPRAAEWPFPRHHRHEAADERDIKLGFKYAGRGSDILQIGA